MRDFRRVKQLLSTHPQDHTALELIDCYSTDICEMVSSVLKNLDHPRFPRLSGRYSIDKTACALDCLRAYMRGQDLETVLSRELDKISRCLNECTCSHDTAAQCHSYHSEDEESASEFALNDQGGGVSECEESLHETYDRGDGAHPDGADALDLMDIRGNCERESEVDQSDAAPSVDMQTTVDLPRGASEAPSADINVEGTFDFETSYGGDEMELVGEGGGDPADDWLKIAVPSAPAAQMKKRQSKARGEQEAVPGSDANALHPDHHHNCRHERPRRMAAPERAPGFYKERGATEKDLDESDADSGQQNRHRRGRKRKVEEEDYEEVADDTMYQGQRKECTNCGDKLPLYKFNRNSDNPSGYQSHCRKCREDRGLMRAGLFTDDDTKPCNQCGFKKCLSEFTPDVTGRMGRMSKCKKCNADNARALRETKKGRRIARTQEMIQPGVPTLMTKKQFKAMLNNEAALVADPIYLVKPVPPPRPSADELLSTPLMTGLHPDLMQLLTWTMNPGPLPIPFVRVRPQVSSTQEDSEGEHSNTHSNDASSDSESEADWDFEESPAVKDWIQYTLDSMKLRCERRNEKGRKQVCTFTRKSLKKLMLLQGFDAETETVIGYKTGVRIPLASGVDLQASADRLDDSEWGVNDGNYIEGQMGLCALEVNTNYLGVTWEDISAKVEENAPAISTQEFLRSFERKVLNDPMIRPQFDEETGLPICYYCENMFEKSDMHCDSAGRVSSSCVVCFRDNVRQSEHYNSWRRCLSSTLADMKKRQNTRANRAHHGKFKYTPEMWKNSWIKHKGLCAVSHIPLEPAIYSPYKASPDRIDSDKGYLEENVQLVCRIFNTTESEKRTRSGPGGGMTRAKFLKFLNSYRANKKEIAAMELKIRAFRG